jgi:hypothetical protein
VVADARNRSLETQKRGIRQVNFAMNKIRDRLLLIGAALMVCIVGVGAFPVADCFSRQSSLAVVAANGAERQSPQDTCLTPLISAIKRHDVIRANAIADSGVDLDAHSCRDEGATTALIETVVFDEKELARRLLLKGADANVSDGAGVSALMFAAWHCRTEIASDLIAHGAQINGTDANGYTPLMHSVQNCRNGTITALLLRFGANPNSGAKDGSTALTTAAFYANEEAVRLLIGAGADLLTKTQSGETALMIARDRHVARTSSHDRIYELLVQVSELDALRSKQTGPTSPIRTPRDEP